MFFLRKGGSLAFIGWDLFYIFWLGRLLYIKALSRDKQNFQTLVGQPRFTCINFAKRSGKQFCCLTEFFYFPQRFSAHFQSRLFASGQYISEALKYSVLSYIYADWLPSCGICFSYRPASWAGKFPRWFEDKKKKNRFRYVLRKNHNNELPKSS